MPLDFDIKWANDRAVPGHNNPPEPIEDRPQKVTKKQVITHPFQRLKDIIDRVPYKWVSAVVDNPKNKECCRKVDNLSIEARKTDATLRSNDLVVIQCDCGCNHYRFALSGPGQS